MGFAGEKALSDIAGYLKGLYARFQGNVPPDATQTFGKNTTAITSTAAQTILAAPGAGNALYIKKVRVSNSHATDNPVIILKDSAGSPVEIGRLRASALGVDAEIIFDPPVKLTANTALTGETTGTLGTTIASAYGFIGRA